MADPVVLDTFSETVIAGVELVGAEIPNLPDRIATALKSADVQNAITNALTEFASARVNKTPTTVSAEDAKALADAIATAAGNAGKENVIKQIKNSSHYKDLDQKLKDLADALKKSPMGIWVEDNKTWLYIVGAGAVLGGAAAMYATRSGDQVTKLATPLLKGSVSFKPIGKLKFSTGVDEVTFTPSKHIIEAKTFVAAKWDNIQARLNVSVSVADKTVTARADGSIVVPVNKDVSVTAGGAFDSSKKNWSLSVGVKVDVIKGVQLGVFAGLGKGAVGTMPGGDPFKAIPPPPKDPNDRTGGFVGLGVSGHF